MDSEVSFQMREFVVRLITAGVRAREGLLPRAGLGAEAGAEAGGRGRRLVEDEELAGAARAHEDGDRRLKDGGCEAHLW